MTSFEEVKVRYHDAEVGGSSGRTGNTRRRTDSYVEPLSFHVDWGMLYFEAHSQGVVEVGSKAEELDQGPERRLRVPTKKTSLILRD